MRLKKQLRECESAAGGASAGDSDKEKESLRLALVEMVGECLMDGDEMFHVKH